MPGALMEGSEWSWRPPPPPPPLLPSIDPFADDGWDSAEPDVHIECLMPNGIVVPLDVPKVETLENIKQKLWDTEFPLHGTLREPSQYVFQCVTPQAEAIELVDEGCPLISVRPVFRVLRVIEREGDKEEKLLKSQIGHLIGKNLHEFESLNNAEVNEFRGKMRELCVAISGEKDNLSWTERIQYSYPCAVSMADQMPTHLLSQLPTDNHLSVVVEPQAARENQAGYVGTTFRVPPDVTPHQLVGMALDKMARTSVLSPWAAAPSAHYTLKVLGRQQYLVHDVALWRFEPVQRVLSRGERVRLLLVRNSSISLPDCEPRELGIGSGVRSRATSSSGMMPRRRPATVSSWDIEQQFGLTIGSVANLPVGHFVTEMGLDAALFCGTKRLCESQRVTQPLAAAASDCAVPLERCVQFSVQVRDLPRMTRLSLAVYEVARQSRGIKSNRLANGKFCNYLAWVNAPVYDYRGHLRVGAVTLFMWPYQESMAASEEAFQPLATVVANPDCDQATQISVRFDSYCSEGLQVVYPSVEKMHQYAYQAATNGHDDIDSDHNFFGRGNTEQVKLKLAAALERDMRALDLTDRDKKVLWSLRRQCQASHPNALPKLLQCVDWSSHLEVAEMTMLLQKWRLLAPDKSLALLDVNIADTTVRQFAVRCLQKASDEELQLYLLQLVQALKHENYLLSELSEFLLTRAIRSRAIGHWLFWHLRSEMHVPAVSVRNALLLEAYCRAACHHMHSLCRLHDTLRTLSDLNAKVQIKRAAGSDKEKIRESLREDAAAATERNLLTSFVDPLDQNVLCKHPRLQDFTYFESKQAPLRLIFENTDEGGDPVKLIFKAGDDLRQDMLTLQTIRIIDKLWKDQGLDLRLNPYGCISTGHRVGVIELVQGATTVATIHKRKGVFKPTAAFRRDTIFNWLRDHNRCDEDLARAVRQFSLSCAGYSVITFVLGIADRHSDNVMVKENGQLLHIDFGHILGHFKEKFGIRRERVPFVLTTDFVYVISGGDKPNHEYFVEFRANCEKAYLILRRHSDFIISLFGMMLSTGLPDVSSENDLCFLYDTLRPSVSEEEALKFFREKFDEAMRNSISASINNAFHVIFNADTTNN